MKRLCIIQPLLSNYSRETFLELTQYCQVDLVYSPAPSETGFGDVPPPENDRLRYFIVPTLKPFGERFGMIQWGIGKYIWRERPNAIMASGNPRYLSFWMTLLWGKLLGIPTYIHGHGLYKKRRISALYRLMMTALLKLATSYICYAPIVRQSFLDHGFSGRKLSVAHNSQTNHYPVPPQEKTGSEKGVLFIGRLREGNKLPLLVRALDRIRREDGLPLMLHVIGTGAQAELVKKEARERPWMVLHGELFDQERIREVSRDCFLGCYPGNAGLSVEHLMSLSLPVITHNDLPSHQGPEPSFIRNGVSGLLYDHNNPEESLYRAIRSLASEPQLLAKMRQSAFEEYQGLVNPSLAHRFWMILGDGKIFPENASLTAPAWVPNSSSGSRTVGHD
jgi:glycosyltransferase involved in cell wall biosynthesis